MEKVIYSYVFSPHDAIFKSSRNDKAEHTTVTCSNSENCGLYKRGECCWVTSFDWQSCPYGKFKKDTGYTKKAMAYRGWLDERKNRHNDITVKLTGHKRVMAQVGEYVFLPYAHITMNGNVPFLQKGGLFTKENCFLPMSQFTIDNIISMCNYKPQAMVGGTITSYQEEVVPLFIKHLSEVFPVLYDELIKVYEPAKEVVNNYNYIGRSAILQTLTPNIGLFVDIHKGQWSWDGEYLTSTNSKASFMLASTFSEIRVKPLDYCIVKITSNEQVNKNTKFTS